MHLYTQPIEDWHFDIVLKRKLIEGWQDEDQLGACYVVPPVGSFIPHITGCSMDRKGQRIQGMFGLDWCQEGTRKRHEGQVHRKLYKWTKKAGEQIGREVQLPEDLPDLTWRTSLPPSAIPGACLPPVGGLPAVGVWAEGTDQPPEEVMHDTLANVTVCVLRACQTGLQLYVHFWCTHRSAPPPRLPVLRLPRRRSSCRRTLS